MPGIDAVIVTYNSADQVGDAVRSLRACPHVGAVVVVDNASEDESAQRAREAGAQPVIENRVNAGFAAAVNGGVGACSGDYVLLLNPDARLTAGSLDLLAAALDEQATAAMAGAVLIDEDGRPTLGARRFSTAVNRLLPYLPSPWRPRWSTPEYAEAARMAAAPEPLPVDYLWGAALLIRRAFLDDIGGLDERFFLYSEDEDLGRQARARGLTSLLVPRARAVHVGGASTPDRAAALASLITANALLLHKWDGARAAATYRHAVGPVLATRAWLLTVAGRDTEAALTSRARARLRTSRTGRFPALGYASGTARVALRVVATRVLRASGDGHVKRAVSVRPPGAGDRPATPGEQRSARDGRPPAPHAPLVSVIVPVRDAAARAPYLRAALRSVAAQDCAALELVVVDDGSTDETAELVTAFLGESPELCGRLLRKSNGGQSSARNAGVRASRGEWVAFLDQDDLWTPDHLRIVLPHLREGVDLVYTDADTIDQSGAPAAQRIHQTLGRGGGHPKRDVAEAIFEDVYVMPGVMTIRRPLFDAVGGFDEALAGYEDDDLFVRCLEAGTVHYVPVSTLQWRIHGGSASHTSRMIDSGLHYWHKLMERYATGDGAADVGRRLSLRFLRTFLSYASNQLLADDPLFRRNLAAAETLLPYLSPVDRRAFAATRWAWQSKTLAARCARSWFLNGLESATG